MSDRDKLIEAIKREMHGNLHWTNTAQEHAQAALTALEALGLAVVPREPAKAMKLAGCDVLICNSEKSWAIAAGNAYRAMLAAAPLPAAPNQAASDNA